MMNPAETGLSRGSLLPIYDLTDLADETFET